MNLKILFEKKRKDSSPWHYLKKEIFQRKKNTLHYPSIRKDPFYPIRNNNWYHITKPHTLDSIHGLFLREKVQKKKQTRSRKWGRTIRSPPAPTSHCVNNLTNEVNVNIKQTPKRRIHQREVETLSSSLSVSSYGDVWRGFSFLLNKSIVCKFL